MKREISYEKIVSLVKENYFKACLKLPEEQIFAFKKALEKEENLLAKAIFEILLKNAELAEKKSLPLCQDTGIPVVWVRIGEKIKVNNLEKAINEGLYLAFKEGCLRASVCDPLTRKNTLTNTPAIIHYEIISEDIFEIYLMPKGCGSENMSALCMLSPSVGIEGIKKFVIEIVKKAGPNPCPPIIVGVGIGGNFEKVALLAKRALFRPLGESNPDPEIAKLEKELLEEINSLGIGPLGFGGKITCLGVHIETYPCHIASLPVAVNIQCHSARLARIKLI
ncbi:MAG: fumarate hydratase [Thermodesulfobacterium geofontis]|uniref:Fumarate hydratase n=1 Tax=Thermodesulfobacterium geofontis TaxID=1295609 RepID=A0A2N7PMN1_9BACT|nr:MAG: fumarate hydratase [Thermodesulfobacterium geofontis]